MKRYVIIVAGGSGNRMKTNVPKQFLLLAGKPVLMHTIQRFFDTDSSIDMIVVLPENEIGTWEKLCIQHAFVIPHRVTPGGATRFQSVKNGLVSVKQESIVAIHDGVRPFVSSTLINRCFKESGRYGNAVPAIALDESIREIEGDKNKTADRSSFVIIQTPQCYDSKILIKAYDTGFLDTFTDDASVVEHDGHTIHLVAGEKENIKITFPIDLLTGEAFLKNETVKQ